MMKSLLTLKRYMERSSDTASPVGEVRNSPGLYECSSCAQVFITSPSECSRCGSDEFAQVPDFERNV